MAKVIDVKKIQEENKRLKKKKSKKELKDLIKKYGTSKLKEKNLLKKNKMTVKIPEVERNVILNEENKFFKGELNQEKRNLFFS